VAATVADAQDVVSAKRRLLDSAAFLLRTIAGSAGLQRSCTIHI